MYLRNDVTAGLNRKTYPIRSFAGIDALTDESSLPLTYCRYGYNIAFKNGTLVSGIGINEAKIEGINVPASPEEGAYITNCWIYTKPGPNNQSDYRLMVALSSGRLYQKPLYGEGELTFTGAYWGGKCVCMNYKMRGVDVFLVFLETGGMYIYDGEIAEYVIDAPWLNSACLHYGKIYATQYMRNRVVFGSPEFNIDFDFSPDNGGGYIEFSGEGGTVRKVISFNDHLFIFRDKAIHRLTAYTDFTEFRLIDVYCSNCRIFPDTITICGNRIIFLAEDGLYTFDGYTARKIYSQVTELIENKSFAAACWYGHKYYLAAKLKTDAKTVGAESIAAKNNGIIIFDFDLDNIAVFRGADIRAFSPMISENLNELFVGFNSAFTQAGQIDDSGNLFGQPLLKKWQSPMTELSALDKDKILRKVFLSTVYPLKFTVEGEEKTEMDIEPSLKIQMLPVNKKAEKIRLTLETDSDVFYLSSMLLEFDLVRRKYA